ncbi:MAG: TnpV protein [Clostridiales Family XIII bacterium]|nr:TnpV protein [Clostridiales Family XIII bacterium]
MSELNDNNAVEYPERVYDERLGWWYKKDENDIYYLDIDDDESDIPVEPVYDISPRGRAHERFIKEYRKSFYNSLLCRGELNKYLAQISDDAFKRHSLIVKQMADADPLISEELKMNDPEKWIGLMNNIRNRADEIVNAELIYV